MHWLWWVLISAGIIILLVFLTALICFFKVFYSPKRKPLGENDFPIPDGEIYEPFREEMVNWIKMTRSMPYERVSIKSFDGLTLRGKYYECAPGAPVELQFHGYKGCAERDMSGGVERAFALGRSVMLIDQRASGESDGHVISFGINEHKDCLKWVEYAVERFGKDVKIILTGISMGAATVVMASGKQLPDNVVCVLADCGYDSAKAIIMKVISEMELPAKLLYPFVKLGARVYGGFDLEETSPVEAVKNCKAPLIMFHGDTDAFVPYEMSEKVYAACPHKNKRLVKIEGAGHGLAFPVDKELYINSMRETIIEWNL